MRRSKAVASVVTMLPTKNKLKAYTLMRISKSCSGGAPLSVLCEMKNLNRIGWMKKLNKEMIEIPKTVTGAMEDMAGWTPKYNTPVPINVLTDESKMPIL